MKPVTLETNGPACVSARDAEYVVPRNSGDIVDAWNHHQSALNDAAEDKIKRSKWFFGLPEPLVILAITLFSILVFLPWIVSTVLGVLHGTGPVAVSTTFVVVCCIVGTIGWVYCVIGLTVAYVRYYRQMRKLQATWDRHDTLESYLKAETPDIYQMMLLPGRTDLRVRGAELTSFTQEDDSDPDSDYGEVGGAGSAEGSVRAGETEATEGAGKAPRQAVQPVKPVHGRRRATV